MSNTAGISDNASKEDLEYLINHVKNDFTKRDTDQQFNYLKEICLLALKDCIENLKPEPSPNIDEHIGRLKPNHLNGGILNGWNGKFPFVEPLKNEGKGDKVKGVWQDLFTLRRNPEYEQKIKDFFETYKNDTKVYIFDLSKLPQENETVNPPKMGKKKLKLEIERLRDVLEMVENEKKQTEQAHLGKDLESVVKILGKYGNVEMNQQYSHSEESVRKTITITMNC
jgi:hypothetical protein